jgi:ribulose-5-phosphate 4-epimerase/fuculose-1-phosphate aldolase
VTPAPGDRGLDDLRDTVATACRILGRTGVAREITGHVSARIPGRPHEMLLRCRTEAESGLAATTVEAIRTVDLRTGAVDDPTQADVPVELPIPAAVLAARPDVAAVVHVHPKHCLLCGIAGVPLRPIYGAYDHHASLLVEDGLPVLETSVLIRDDTTAAALVAALGSAGACLMRGHGITVVGASVEQATLRTLRLEHLAEITWQLHLAGYTGALPAEELAAFASARSQPVLPKGERWAWNHYAADARPDGQFAL